MQSCQPRQMEFAKHSASCTPQCAITHAPGLAAEPMNVPGWAIVAATITAETIIQLYVRRSVGRLLSRRRCLLLELPPQRYVLLHITKYQVESQLGGYVGNNAAARPRSSKRFRRDDSRYSAFRG
eukprot:1279733-Prymnesium_polylepis.1